jgi:Recombinase
MLIARYAEKGSRASAIARATLARVRAADILPVINTLQADGVTTLWRIAETLNERGIPAPRGGSWSPMQVSRVIALS